MIFEKKFFITKNEVKNFAWKNPNIFKEAFKGSPSEREKIWNGLQKYWPDSLGSLNKIRLQNLKKNISRDVYYGETEEKRKEAKKVLKFIESLEKYFPS